MQQCTKTPPSATLVPLCTAFQSRRLERKVGGPAGFQSFNTYISAGRRQEYFPSLPGFR